MRLRQAAEVVDEVSDSGAEVGVEVHAVSVGTPAESSAPANASERTPLARSQSCGREDDRDEVDKEVKPVGVLEKHWRTGSTRPPWS